MSRIDPVITSLESAVAEAQPSFEKRYGKLAGALLPHLPSFFQLLRRLAFDLALPQKVRHQAAAAALYIADTDDFLVDTSAEGRGLVDDVWVAAAAVSQLADAVDDDTALARHWRAGAPFEEVLGMARNHASLEEHVPKRVLDSARSFLQEA